MLGSVNGIFVNVVKSARKTFYSTYTNSGGEVLPIVTMSFASFVENGGSVSTSIIYLQFLGLSNIEKLMFHFKTGINGINVNGHLAQFSLPKSDEVIYNYSEMLKFVENQDEITYVGLPTTVIRVDSFSSTPFMSNSDFKDHCVAKDLDPTGYSITSGMKFTGITNIKPSISSDGDYVFGKSTAKNNPNKVRFSVAGITRNGNDYAKLRLEMHGVTRVPLFESIVKSNNSLVVAGNLIIYNSKDGTVTYGVWVNQFIGFNYGNTETIGGICGSSELESINVSNAESETDWESYTSSDNSNNENGLISEDLPF